VAGGALGIVRSERTRRGVRGDVAALSFFASRKIAEAFRKESAPDQPLETLATTIRRIFPTAIAEYARLGRAIALALAADAGTEQTPRRATKTGRNDPCPCGSGRKYKKCGGAAAP
jgi:uncharacterized protein YecA (UPF0149 family)